MFDTEFLDIPALRGVHGAVRLPGSKSISNRVLLLAALCEGQTTVHDLLDSDDTRVMLDALRALGCGVQLIPDGDVAGVIAVTNPETTIDLYMGSGGAPEGVLAAAALRCVGGQFNGRLLFRNEDERSRARKWGIEDLNKIYRLEELAKGDCIFAATGVTDGSLLDGVKRRKDGTMTTHTVVMRASSGTIRWVKGEHRKR